MKKIWELDPLAFEEMLDWLDKDRNTAGHKYEAIRLRLIKVFNYRGCSDGESLADIVIDRVTRKAESLKKNYQGDPAHYFLSVAGKVYLEYRRNPEMIELSPDIAEQNNKHAEEDIQPEYDCLKKCLAEISKSEIDRHLIIGYYSAADGEKNKISRKNLAEKLGLTMDALKVKACRLRQRLERCINDCLLSV